MRIASMAAAAALAWAGCAACVLAQERADMEIAVERPVVVEGDTIFGGVRTTLPVPEVLVTWSDPFGAVWFSTRVTPRGAELALFSFQALGCITPVGFIEASTASNMTAAPLTVFPKTDRSWDGFLLIADRPPAASGRAAMACRRLGVTAAITSGHLEALIACRTGLRPMASGMISGGVLSLAAGTVAASVAQYEKTGATKVLERTPSLADRGEIARVAGELSPQVALARKLAPLCYVVADSPSVARGTVPVDYSFSPADLQGFSEYLQRRLQDAQSIPDHWKTATALTDVGALRPRTARETKSEIQKNPGALVDIAPWALHREYMDLSLSLALRDLSNAAFSAARSGSPDNFNWSMTVPITAVSGLSAPSAYGGYDYETLPASADVLMLSADAPQWSWQLVRDLARNGKVFVRIDSNSKDAAAAVWRAVEIGAAGVVIDNFDGLAKEAFGPPAEKTAAPAAGAAPGAAAGELAAALAEVSRGLADAAAAGDNDASVALVYSSAAVRAGWMVDYLAGEGLAPANPQAGTSALAAWPEILSDLGVDFEWISLADIRQGLLSQVRYTAVILPEIWCVDAAAGEALSAYVTLGGTLIADNAAGMLDGEYSARRFNPVDEFFGIRRTPLSGERAKTLAPGAACDPKKPPVADEALVISARTAAASTGRITDKAAASRTLARTVILNPKDKGGTVYLNLLAGTYLTGGSDSKAEARAAVAKALAAGLVGTSTFVLQNNRPVAARVSTRILGSTRMIFIQPEQGYSKSIPFEIRLPVAGNFYNLRPPKTEGEYFGNRSTIFLPPPASGPVVLSLEPVPFDGMPVDLEYSADAILVKATLDAPREVRNRLFRIEVYSPSGEHMYQFDRTVKAEKGIFSGAVDLPENAPRGPWRVLVRDLASGMASWADVDVN